MRPDLQEQCEHAIQVLDVIIARTEAWEAWYACPGGDEVGPLAGAARAADERAFEQMLAYRERWAHTR